MRVGVAQNVELEGPIEDRFVVVGRAVEQADALALADRLRRRARCLPVAVRWKQCTGSGPTDDLVGRGVGPVSLEKLPLVGVLEERVHAVGHRVASGLVTRDREQDDEERELDIFDGFAVDVGLRSGG